MRRAGWAALIFKAVIIVGVWPLDGGAAVFETTNDPRPQRFAGRCLSFSAAVSVGSWAGLNEPIVAWRHVSRAVWDRLTLGAKTDPMLSLEEVEVINVSVNPEVGIAVQDGSPFTRRIEATLFNLVSLPRLDWGGEIDAPLDVDAVDRIRRQFVDNRGAETFSRDNRRAFAGVQKSYVGNGIALISNVDCYNREIRQLAADGRGSGLLGGLGSFDGRIGRADADNYRDNKAKDCQRARDELRLGPIGLLYCRFRYAPLLAQISIVAVFGLLTYGPIGFAIASTSPPKRGIKLSLFRIYIAVGVFFGLVSYGFVFVGPLL